jgi:hypothetical protein
MHFILDLPHSQKPFSQNISTKKPATLVVGVESAQMSASAAMSHPSTRQNAKRMGIQILTYLQSHLGHL